MFNSFTPRITYIILVPRDNLFSMITLDNETTAINATRHDITPNTVLDHVTTIYPIKGSNYNNNSNTTNTVGSINDLFAHSLRLSQKPLNLETTSGTSRKNKKSIIKYGIDHRNV